MTSSENRPATAPIGGLGVIETAGIEIIAESERTAKPRDLIWPWFAANVSVFGMSYGSYLLGFGISFLQATIVAVIGIVISFLLCGLVAIAGKRGSVPTMVLSRAAFGVHGQKVPGVVSWLTSIGWETVLAISAVLATATVFDVLGIASGTAVTVIATILIAALIVGASVLGYHTIMRMQSILTWATGAMTILFMILTIPHIDWQAVASMPHGSPQAMIGALVMVMTGFGLGWINIAADWSRYQKRSASDGSIVLWNTVGGAAAPVVLVIFGLLLAGSDEGLSGAIEMDPIGALVTILPLWALIPFWIVAVLTLVSGAVLGIYIGPFQSFLITLGVPIAAWAGILIADVVSRRAAYDEKALFDPSGRYGAFDWTSIVTMVLASVLGWGLVVNSDADAAPWNNWQGYLLEPLGLGTFVEDPGGSYWDGNWAYSNIGVLLALVLGFAVTIVARRGKIRAQEQGA